MLVKKELQNYIKVNHAHSSKLVLWFSISHELLSSDQDLHCGVVYIPPIGSKYANEDPYAEIQAEMLQLCANDPHILLMGDFNSRTGEKEDLLKIDEFLSDKYGLEFLEDENAELLGNFKYNNIPFKRTNADKTVNTYGNQMIEFCRTSNLFILNGRFGRNIQNSAKYTCKDKSVIDYFLSSPSLFSLIDGLNVLDFDNLFSDAHCPVSVTLRTCKVSSDQENENKPCKEKETTKLWDKNKSTSFQQNFSRDLKSILNIEIVLKSLQIRGSVNENEINDIVNKIGSLFENCAEESFGKVHQRKENTGHRKPWFDRECRRMRNKYHFARKAYNMDRSYQNKYRLKQVSASYKQTMHNSVKKFKQIRIETLKRLKKADPREYWRILNSNAKRDKCQASLSDLYDYFKNVNSSNPDEEVNSRNTVNNNRGNDSHDNEDLNVPICEAEVEKAIKNLKNNKSPGVDNIKNEHIRHTSTLMIPVYTKLFNLIFDSGIIPESWTLGVIKPIYKNKGNPKSPENYRPITILSCLGKLFTSIINNRLNTYIDKHNILESCQAGFRKNHATIDNLFVIKSLIDIAKTSRKKLFCCFIDFKQAFDTVWRNGLWEKMYGYHINGKCLSIIQSIYQNVKSKVMTHNGATMYFPCLTGVRQGENLSPLLFSLYVNDLNHFLAYNNIKGTINEIAEDEILIYLKILILLYADDTVLFSDTDTDMQHALNIFQLYCQRWRLTVNVDKTKVVIFSGGKTKSYQFMFDEQKLEITNDYKYLGIFLTRGGAFNTAKKHIAEQANKAMFSLLTKANALGLPTYLQLELFDKTIKPILLYAAEIWGYGSLQVIERVHLKFIKHIFHLKKSTPTHMIYGELGIYPITLEIKHRMLTFWCKVISDCNDEDLGLQKLSTCVYSLVYNMHRNNKIKSDWLDCIEHLVCTLGFSGFWLTQQIANPKWLIAAFKQKLHDQYIQQWMETVHISSSSSNFRIFKTSFERSPYLHVLSDTLSRTLIKFRTRNHRFPVEKGRWTGLTYSERKCEMCNTDIGDEFHFLFKCERFRDDRKKFLKPYFYKNPNVIKYNELMNVNNTKVLKDLCKFINKIMKVVR